MTTILQRIEGDLDTGFNFAKKLLEQIVEEEVALLIPVAEDAVKTIVADPAVLLTPAGWVAAAVSVATQVAQTAATKGLQVAGTSILTAAGSALANLKTTP